MGVFQVSGDDGRQFVWDPDGMYIAIRSSLRNTLIRQRSRTVEHRTGIFMPTTWELETRWSGFRAELDRETNRFWPEAEMQLRTDPSRFFGTFVTFVQQGLEDQQFYHTTRAQLQHRTMTNISNNVDNWGTAITVLRTIRDGSATFLIVTGTIVTGGLGGAAAAGAGLTGVSASTAMSSIALGSAMRGGFTYQDTGNVGSAVINATGSFIVGAIGLGGAGATLTSAETGTLLIIGSAGSGLTAGAQTVVEGGSLRDAAVTATIGLAGGLAGGALGTRIEGMSFVVQTVAGTVADLGTGAISRAATAPSTVAAPATMGRIDFAGIPPGSAEAFVRRTAFCPI